MFTVSASYLIEFIQTVAYTVPYLPLVGRAFVYGPKTRFLLFSSPLGEKVDIAQQWPDEGGPQPLDYPVARCRSLDVSSIYDNTLLAEPGTAGKT